MTKHYGFVIDVTEDGVRAEQTLIQDPDSLEFLTEDFIRNQLAPNVPRLVATSDYEVHSVTVVSFELVVEEVLYAGDKG